MQILFHLIRL